MNHQLYTYLGCVTALQFTIQRSAATDKATALAASNELAAVGESLLIQLGADADNESFKELLGTQVTTVLEAVEALKQTSILQEIHPTLLAILEYYYTAADRLMGGGGWIDGWPTSITSADEI